MIGAPWALVLFVTPAIDPDASRRPVTFAIFPTVAACEMVRRNTAPATMYDINEQEWRVVNSTCENE